MKMSPYCRLPWDSKEGEEAVMKLRIALFIGIIALSFSTVVWAESDSKVRTDSDSKKDLLRKGPQLWAQSCMRCHNFRSPKSLSDREWDIAVHHMRVRANLTAEEAEAILIFLKSAN